MNERRVLLFILFVIVYCMYSVQMWLINNNVNENIDTNKEKIVASKPRTRDTTQVKNEVKKVIPLFMKDSCSVLQIFTEKPQTKFRRRIIEQQREQLNAHIDTMTVIGIIMYLILLMLNAIVDVVKAKEEEQAQRELNPDGERRQSLAEFANKKPLRRESNKFGRQGLQNSQSVSRGKEKKNRHQNRPYSRGESINSYLSDRNSQVESSPPSTAQTPAEPRLVKRQTVAKLFGARPVPMTRRSSFPALPQNPDIQALMLGHRQHSIDSDDEDGKGRRVRIIRRY